MKAEEKRHLNRVAALGCVACRQIGIDDSPSEIHHVRAGQGMGQRASNFDVIPLCHAHHRTGGYGVALHAGQKAFEDKYGTEERLLQIVEGLLRGGL